MIKFYIYVIISIEKVCFLNLFPGMKKVYKLKVIIFTKGDHI